MVRARALPFLLGGGHANHGDTIFVVAKIFRYVMQTTVAPRNSNAASPHGWQTSKPAGSDARKAALIDILPYPASVASPRDHDSLRVGEPIVRLSGVNLSAALVHDHGISRSCSVRQALSSGLYVHTTSDSRVAFAAYGRISTYQPGAKKFKPFHEAKSRYFCRYTINAGQMFHFLRYTGCSDFTSIVCALSSCSPRQS